MEKAYLSESEMAARKDGRFYCFSFKPVKPSGCFMYRQVQHQIHVLYCCVCFPFSSIMWRYSVQRLTEVGHEIWELLISIHARPKAKCVCHCVDFHETRVYYTTICEELLYRIS